MSDSRTQNSPFRGFGSFRPAQNLQRAVGLIQPEAAATAAPKLETPGDEANQTSIVSPPIPSQPTAPEAPITPEPSEPASSPSGPQSAPSPAEHPPSPLQPGGGFRRGLFGRPPIIGMGAAPIAEPKLDDEPKTDFQTGSVEGLRLKLGYCVFGDEKRAMVTAQAENGREVSKIMIAGDASLKKPQRSPRLIVGSLSVENSLPTKEGR